MRRFINRFLTLVFLPLSGLIFAATPAPVAIPLKGAVEVLRDSGQWAPVQKRETLQAGEQLRTLPGGAAEISFGKDASIGLDENTVLTLKQLSETGGRFSLEKGLLAGSIRNPVATDSWVFTTQGSISAVRGAEFILTHNSETGTNLGVFTGAVDIDLLNRSGQPVGAGAQIQEGQEGMVHKGAIESWSQMSDEMKARQPVFKKLLRPVRGRRN